MKIVLDENVSLALAGALSRIGHEVVPVVASSHRGSPDKRIWELAQTEHALLIIRDHHFTKGLVYPPAECQAVFFIRPGNLSSIQETEIIQEFLEHHEQTEYEGRLVTLSPVGFQIR